MLLPERGRVLRKRRLRLGLRTRVTLGFGLMALLLSLVLTITVWFLVTGNLFEQKAAASVVESTDNATQLSRALPGAPAGIPTLLDGLPTGEGAVSLLRYEGEWYSTLPTRGSSVVPADLAHLVLDGQAAQQRLRLGDEPYLMVGVPLPGSGGAYFELFPLDDLNHTYQVLSAALVATAVMTSALGLGFGYVASRRTLRPLQEVNEAAAEIARGNLDARLEASGDADLEQLARSFNSTAENLQRRVAADARFASDVSHELRTPLTTMLNSMQFLQRRRDEMPEPVREPLDLLGADLERFRRLVLDLLEISRDDGGDPGLRERVRIADLVQRAADAVAGRPVTTVTDDARPATVLADKRRLERVVSNLVENAETHGGGCVGVTVSRLSPEAVAVTVDDAGPGVPDAMRDRIFERFSRAAEGERPGVGLGLAIVSRHVEWHGGTVALAPRPGGGSRFVVTLPVEGARRG
jgi:signal transduction histidine kinase